MKAADYTIAAIPEPWQILGLRLKPLSIGHYLLMERFGVAFVSAGEEIPKLSDLVLGVLICSMTYEEFLASAGSGQLIEDIKAWGKKCGGKGFDFAEKSALFRRYILEGCNEPTVIYEDDGTQGGGHWTQYVLGALVGPCGYSLVEARNLPLSQALSDFYRYGETLGVVRIVSPEIAELMRQAEENPEPQNEFPGVDQFAAAPDTGTGVSVWQ